jgi:hypothetical protein
MTNTLFRSVYLDGVHLAPGTELTDEQAKRITNPNATEDRSIKGQGGKPGEGDDAAPATGQGTGDDEAPGRRPTKATR